MAATHHSVDPDLKLAEEGNLARAQSTRDYTPVAVVPFIDAEELGRWSLYRACIAEFMSTLLFLYFTILTITHFKDTPGVSVGIYGIATSFGIMIFILVFCIAGVSGGHINPAVSLAMLLARRISLPRWFLYTISQMLGGIVGVGIVKGLHKSEFNAATGGANFVQPGYSNGAGLGAEIIGTFVLVFVVFSATDPKRAARDFHIPALAPLAIGFTVFVVHVATIPVTGTGINPARSFASAVVAGSDKAWDDHWIFWLGPYLGALLAVIYYEYVIKLGAFKTMQRFRQ
eukprot:SM000021S06406  [mRNA]  locus=s21:60589:63068:- [translate_table: standard]